MIKIIKKTLKYFIIIFGIIVLLPTMLSFILRIPEVQTLLVKRITNHISESITSTIDVGKFEYRFFNRLNLSDVLIKDRNNDTLIYLKKITAGVRRVDFRKKNITFGRIIINDPVISLITDSTGTMNLAWYLNLLRNPSDTTIRKKGIFKINQVDFSNARFSLAKMINGKPKAGINFGNIRLTGLNGIIEDFVSYNDTTSFDVYNLGFRESDGFTVRRMAGSVFLAKNNVQFKSVSLNCDSSSVSCEYARIKGDPVTGFKDFTTGVNLDIMLNQSLVSFYDLSYFVPALKNFNGSVKLSGRISGPVSEMRGRNIKMAYKDHTGLDCDFDISGLPDIENSFIYLGINKLETNAGDFKDLKTPENKTIPIPDILYKLGDISFSGSFTGFTTDFVAYGKAVTNRGTISTDISLRPEQKNRFKIKGLITGSSIALGTLANDTVFFGNVSLKANVDGYAYSLKKFSGNIKGSIDSIEVNRYKYRNISMNGNFSDKTWDGNVQISDDNIKMDLLGMFSFSSKLPEFDFTLNLSKANLYKLNFDKNDTTSGLSMLLTANFKGNNIDNLDGEIKLLNSTLRKYGNDLDLYDFSIKTFAEDSKPAISLRTDFMDADLKGYYNFAGLGAAFKRALSYMMPSRFPPINQDKVLPGNNFIFNVNFKNTDKINSFFKTGLLLSENSILGGTMIPDSVITIHAEASSLTFKNNTFKNLTVDASYFQHDLTIKLNSSALNLIGQSDLKDFAANFSTKPDNFIFSLNWNNGENTLSNKEFLARGSFIGNSNGNGLPVLKIDIDSTNIHSGDNIWKICQSSIVVDSNAVRVNNLNISNKERYYTIDGTVSGDPRDTLHLKFRGINIQPLNYLVEKKNETGNISLSLKGQLDGKLLLTNMYRNPLIESSLKVNGFSMLDSDFGDLYINSDWNSEKKVVDIHVRNLINENKSLDISGNYDPDRKKLNLTARADKLQIDALNPLLKVFASEISGTATGKVKLTAADGRVFMNGALKAENTSLKIDYLQTIFKLNDSIRFDDKGIKFDNVRVTDEKGNPATLSGYVYHTNFKNYMADLIVNITEPDECLVLNTRPKDNDLFYGTAYASGVITIKSGPSSLSFDISAATGKNTIFNIPLNSSETVSDYSFITFISHDSVPKNEAENAKNLPVPAQQTAMDLNFDLDVTPEARVNLIFDSKIGDEMEGSGSGKLNINLNRKGEFKISGDYLIDDGTYLFTLGNIINKKFIVENGGKITFNGDINDAIIDIKADYTVKTSLYPILQDENYNKPVNVVCQIHLSGNLFNPLVDLNIDLPLADEQTKTSLKNAITTEEEKNRQFLYLLVMNQFYSELPSGTTLTSASTGTSAVAVTTSEMISNQLSNWISQISNDFNLGFVYRPGMDINPQELEMAFQTQVFNDKVVINGNFDVRGQGGISDNTEPLTGDFDVEIKLTDKIKFKVFNRFNNPYTGKQSQYTQGLGFFFTRDFDKFSDLLRRKKKSPAKKEDEPVTTAR